MVVVETVVSPDPVAAAPLCATPPLTGTTTISGVVNTYYPGTTATLSAGQASTTVTVGAGVGAGTPLAVGDMVLIVQMQGAEINATNTGAYGDGGAGDPATGYLSNANFVAGLYEYATVTSVAGSTIGLAGSGTNGGLNNTYRNANATSALGQFRYQVIRVPQYSGAAFSTGTPPTAPTWNGTTGGVVAIDVAAGLNLNGATLNVSGLGFKGGAQRVRAGTTAAGPANTDYRTLTSQPINGQKGRGHRRTPGLADRQCRHRRRWLSQRRLRTRRTGQRRRWRYRWHADRQRRELGWWRRWQRWDRRQGRQHLELQPASRRIRGLRPPGCGEQVLPRRRRRCGQRQQRRAELGRRSGRRRRAHPRRRV